MVKILVILYFILSFNFLNLCFGDLKNGILSTDFDCMVGLLLKLGLQNYYPGGVICTEKFACGPDIDSGITTLPCIYNVGVTCNTTSTLIEKFIVYNFGSIAVTSSDVSCFKSVNMASFYNTNFDNKFLNGVSTITALNLTNPSLPSIVTTINPSVKELNITLSSGINLDLSLSYLSNLDIFKIQSTSLDDSNIIISLKNDLTSNFKYFKYFQIITNYIPSFKNVGFDELLIQFGSNFNDDFSNFSTFNNVSKLTLTQSKYSIAKSLTYKFPIELSKIEIGNSIISSISINYKLSKPNLLIDFSNFNNNNFELLSLNSIGSEFYIEKNSFPFSKLPQSLKTFTLINSDNLPFLNDDGNGGGLLLDYSIFNGITNINLNSNNFNGTLPSKFNGNNVNYLNLSNNKLKGTIDSSYCTVLLDVSNNQLTGTLPSCYGCYINIPQLPLSSKFIGNSGLNLLSPPTCTTILPQIKIENNNTILYGNDLGFGLSYLIISESSGTTSLSDWKVGTLSKSYYLENFTKPTNFTISFVNSLSTFYTLSTIQNPPFVSTFNFTSYTQDYKVVSFQGSYFTYNSSDISVEFGTTGLYRQCIVFSSTFYEIKCNITNFSSLYSSGSGTLSTVIKIISNPYLKIQFPIDFGAGTGAGNVNTTLSPIQLCFYAQQDANNCNYFNGLGECVSANTCSCKSGWIGIYCSQQTHKITSVIASNQYGGLVIINGEFGLNHVGLLVTIGNGTADDPKKECTVISISQDQITCMSQPGIGRTKLSVGQNNFLFSITYKFNAICSSDCNSLVDNNNYCNNLTGICSCDTKKFQGVDCKTTFIPCQDDCNSALNQGVCNNITGTCSCTNNKWTSSSYCSIPNHYCSSITSAPSGVGGPITLYGWFGDKHDNLQVTIGGLSCNSIISSYEQINCTIPSNSGIQTVNVTQNQLSWIGINAFQYYQVIKSCPNKCSNQGICNTSNGQCKCYNGFTGFDCSATISIIPSSSSTTTTTSPTESTPEPLPVTQSEINKETGTISMKNEETKYKLYIKSLIEVDINKMPVKTYDIQDKWINIDSNDLTGTYLFKQTLTNGGYLTSTIQEIKETKEMNFAGVDFTLDSGSIKVSIEINNYTYSSNLNTLQLLFISSVNISSTSTSSNNCNEGDTQVQNINDSDLNYIKIEKNGKILMGRFVNSVISDNRPTLITSSNLGSDLENSDSIIVALNLPHCIQCQIDPDFSVLVSSSYKSNCDTSSNGRKAWLLPVVIVVPVVCTSIIVAAFITLYKKKSIFFKIKMQSIKLKTRK